MRFLVLTPGVFDKGGISRYDGKSFINFTMEDGLSSNAVWAIYREPDDVIWISRKSEQIE